MKKNMRRNLNVSWMGGVRAVVVLFFLIGVLGACNHETDVELEDNNNLTIQTVAVSNANIQESTNELRQSITSLEEGGFVIVWDNGQYPDRAIMMQWVDAQGTLRLGNEGKSIGYTPGDAGTPVVISRPGGGVYVAFSNYDGQTVLVKVQAFDQTMTAIWPEPVGASFYDNGWEAQTEPCLAPAPSGGVYVSYSCSFTTGLYQIKCQRLDKDGNRLWGSMGATLCQNYQFVTYPKAIPDSSGGLYVFWLNLKDGFAEELEPVLLEGQHLDANGVKSWGSEPKVIHTTNTLARYWYSYDDFLAVTDGAGGAIIAWYDDVDINDGQLDVLAQKLNSDGVGLWGEGVILSDPSTHSELDGIITAHDGGVFISIYESVDDMGNRLLIHRLGTKGEKQWGTYGLELSKPDETRLNYGVYGCFNGKYLNLAWTHQVVPATNDFDVVLARFKADGTMMDPPGGVIIDDTVDKQFSRGMAYDEVSKSYFLLWEDSRRSLSWDDFDIYGALLKRDDSSISTQLSRSAAPLSTATTAKKTNLSHPPRIDINGADIHQPFHLPGQKVFKRRDK